ncbi:ATP-binding cassette subfamily B multidrug efflux pump [Parabacteroides sp. PFB2-10]|uniref:ABC transporter ATP-binding protein n=1 Tax=Parabacteroides sp. PFB2-10 TaxID=1742405 RepID=UPI002474AAD5|nr:ABC transporter ATP-binding protein [Parabacteroides sp. PFB2-10]MDH6312783.1 ATP-binding cassette subfamily B multidrug efflux pump [Parabacteroides sp. PFB2-10]
MKKYWDILKKYKVGLLLSPFLVLAGVVSETIQPYFMSQIVDRGVMQNDLSVITRTGTLMVVVSLIGLCASIINIYVSSKTSIGFGTDLRGKLFHKIQQLAFPDIDYFSSASLITRLTNDVTRIQQVIMMSMRIMLRAPMMLVMAIFFIININKELALILTASIPLLAVSVFFILKKGFPFFLIVQQKIDALNGVVRENLINIRVVKSFVREEFETEKFTRNSEELRDIVIRASNIIVSLFPAMQLILNLSVLAILWFGGIKVMNSDLQVGELISFVNYLMQVLMSLMMLSMVIMTYARASASSDRIVEVLDKKPSLADTPEGTTNHHRITEGKVAFDHVSFRYSGGETDVLRDINFEIQPGETIAVVGMTGSGKSSLLQLIPRLYDATEGRVRIDDRDVKSYSLDELHRKIGVVLQKNELFSGTIMENLRWGNPEATEEEVEEAARAAEAHDFINSFPEGYNTQLGRGGVNVSGGQKQRLCIARALLRKPKVLILDDSTSAVDSETELKIRSNLATYLQETTLFVITQRIHTMQSADRVIILEDGEIDAIGRPEELMEQSTIYREIYHSQQLVN